MINKRTIQISTPVLGKEELDSLRGPIESGWLTSGPKVREFEEQFAKRHNVKYAFALTSATTALHLAVLALDIQPGDEVIVPAFTWVSSANVVLYAGATPIFVDIDLTTFNIDPEQLKSKISKKTKAIIAVHLFGLCADIDAIKLVAPGIPVIEDGACAAGASYKGIPAGGLGDIGCFSFHPRKSITTGEGGMLTTNDSKIAELVGMLRNHGASISEEQRHHGPKPFNLPEFNHLGYNYRMTDLQGALGVAQLKKLDDFISYRSYWAKWYNSQFKDIPWLLTPEIDQNFSHGWQSYVTMIDESKSPMSRNEIMEYLQENGISTRPGTHAVHMLGYYKNLYKLIPNDFPNAFSANERSMAIPLHNSMTAEDFEYVAQIIKNI